MRLPLLSVSEAERRLLPSAPLRGPTLYVIAIMTFVMMIVAACGLALANAAGVVAAAVEHRYVLPLPSSADGRLEAAVRSVRSIPGVVDIEPVPREEMKRTLERWLGPGGLSEELPVPSIVHLSLDPEADADKVRARLQRLVPGSTLIAEQGTVGPLLASLRALRWLSVAMVLLMAAATSAAVVLAARGALDTHRTTIEIMHGIGATDEQVARLFQRKIALDALAGALAGGASAAAALAIVAGGGAGLARELAGSAPLTWMDLVLLALLPFAAVVLATLVARAAVLSALRQSP